MNKILNLKIFHTSLKTEQMGESWLKRLNFAVYHTCIALGFILAIASFGSASSGYSVFLVSMGKSLEQSKIYQLKNELKYYFSNH